METKFYLKDIQEEVDQKGTLKTIKDVLFFSMSRPSIAGGTTPPTEFDNKATKEHVKQYAEAFLEFKKLNPKFKLPGEVDPVIELTEEVKEEVPVEEEEKPVKKGLFKK